LTGHEFVYQEKVQPDWQWVTISGGTRVAAIGTPVGPFLFKCRHCNLEIKKTKEQLSATERKALVELGIIEPEEKKKK
jgi:hypothetical protein